MPDNPYRNRDFDIAITGTDFVFQAILENNFDTTGQLPIYWGPGQLLTGWDNYTPPVGWRDFEWLQIPQVIRFHFAGPQNYEDYVNPPVVPPTPPPPTCTGLGQIRITNPWFTWPPGSPFAGQTGLAACYILTGLASFPWAEVSFDDGGATTVYTMLGIVPLGPANYSINISVIMPDATFITNVFNGPLCRALDFLADYTPPSGGKTIKIELTGAFGDCCDES